MKVIEVTAEQAQDYMFGLGSVGFCLACGKETDGCEPDARKYRCPSCGAMEVYGFEECLIMGQVTIDGESPY